MRTSEALASGASRDGARDVVLRMRGVHVEFETFDGSVHALNGVDLDLRRGTITGLVGETGCGKSLTARAIMGIVPQPGRLTAGSIEFDGRDLARVDERALRNVRGKEIAMIFQNPRAALNPLFTVERQLDLVLRRHTTLDARGRRQRSLELLRSVGLADPERRLKSYPFELSTGMCQRVMIAIGLSCTPTLLIADEPTTGLDVTIQAQILELLRVLVHDLGSTALLITHDLGVVAQTCDRIAVMYAGEVVETGTTDDVLDRPMHPYTRGLLRASRVEEGLASIAGNVPDLRRPIVGCPFAPRCDLADDRCRSARPPTLVVTPGHTVKCPNTGAAEQGEMRDAP